MTDDLPTLAPYWAVLDSSSTRAPTWYAVYGALSVPIESPVPVRTDSPIGVALFYRVAVKWLSAAQIDRAVAHIARTFDLAEAEVRAGVLGDEGIPILAEDVSVYELHDEPLPDPTEPSCRN